jgi:hypothetical protein
MTQRFSQTAFLVLHLALFWCASADAGWVNGGVPVCSAARNQRAQVAIRTSLGDVVVLWEDWRSGDCDIYAQKIDVDGNILWTKDGIRVCGVPRDQWGIQAIADCSGGVIAVWNDWRNGNVDVYAQRIDGAGASMWQAGGVPVCVNAVNQYYPCIAADNSCGAIIAWLDLRGGTLDVYAQRIGASTGAPAWAPNGMAVYGGAGEQYQPTICSLGSSGAAFSWFDFRSSSCAVYAQRIAENGTFAWTSAGVLCSTARGNRVYPAVVSDGSGGAIVAWQDYSQGLGEGAIVAQNVGATGALRWTTIGVIVRSGRFSSGPVSMVSDGAGGAVLAWLDDPGGVPAVMAQRVLAGGAPAWPSEGVVVSSGDIDRASPQLLVDGLGTIFVAWTDRGGASGGAVYAQRLAMNGSPEWMAGGFPICSYPAEQTRPRIVSDGAGGVVGIWEDARSGQYDIYAQRLCDDGFPISTALRDFDVSSSGSGISIRWTMSTLDEATTFDVYRRTSVDTRAFRKLGGGIDRDRLTFRYLDNECSPESMYVYRVFHRAGGGEEKLLFETEAVRVPPYPLALYPPHPNPFSSESAIGFSLPESGLMRLTIHDVSGRCVATLAQGWNRAGSREISWDGRDDRGRRVAGGIYFCRLWSRAGVVSRKMVVLR